MEPIEYDIHGIRREALHAAVKTHGDGEFTVREVLLAAVDFEAYLRTGAVPAGDEDE